MAPTTVLDIETGIGSGYTLGYPYLQYFSSGNPIFPVTERSIELNAMAWIYGIREREQAKAYPLHLLVNEVVTNDAVADIPIVLVAGRGTIDVNVEVGRLGELFYEAGGEVRAFERPDGVLFAPGPEPATILDQDGREWRVSEEHLVGPSGKRAPRVVGQLSFWFGWFSFFPQSELYDGS